MLRHTVRPLAFALLALSAGLAAAPPAADWPQFRGPTRNGIAARARVITTWPADGPGKLWSASVGIGYSGVSVSDGKAYTMGNVEGVDTVFCLDALTGVEVWKHSYAGAATSWDRQSKSYPGPRATPTVDGGRVYTFSLDANLHCLDAQTGKVIWKKDLPAIHKPQRSEHRWGYASSPLILGRMLIQHLNAQTVALDKHTGERLWRWEDGPKEKGSGGYGSPVIFDNGGKPALAVLTKSLVALGPDDGRELWRVNRWQPYNHGLNAADPIFLGDKVFLSQGNYTRSCAVFRFGGGGRPAKVWRNERSKASMLVHFQSPVLLDGKLYGFHEGKLRCVDFATGKVHWTSDIRTKKYGSLIAAGEKLIVLTDLGELIVAEAGPAGCGILARAQVIAKPAWTAPSLAGGLLYCRNSKGRVVCVDLRKK